MNIQPTIIQILIAIFWLDRNKFCTLLVLVQVYYINLLSSDFSISFYYYNLDASKNLKVNAKKVSKPSPVWLNLTQFYMTMLKYGIGINLPRHGEPLKAKGHTMRALIRKSTPEVHISESAA